MEKNLKMNININKYIYITKSLSCTPKTLQINYTSIKIFLMFNIKKKLSNNIHTCKHCVKI